MKTFLEEVNTTYYVNKDKGIVVCKTTGVLNLAKVVYPLPIFIVREIIAELKKTKFPNIKYEFYKAKLSLEVTRKAVCLPEDTFDEVKGKHIAQTKCQKHIYGYMSYVLDNILVFMQTYFEKLSSASKNLINAHYQAAEHEVELGNNLESNNSDTEFIVEMPSSTSLVHSPKSRVNHPSHYTWLKKLCGVEVIDIARYLDFNIGNVLKYILRAGRKTEEGLSDKAKQIEDLKKAAFYLNDEIKLLEAE